MTRTIPAIALGALILMALPIFAALEKYIIPVRGNIELMLDIDPHIVDFQTVFAQEELELPLVVKLSETFLNTTRVDDVNYSICLEEHLEEGAVGHLGDLGLQIIKFNEGEDDKPCPFTSSLNKSGNDTEDRWNLSLKIPHVLKFDSDDPELCFDDPRIDQSCEEPINGLGLYSAKIQIEVFNISYTNETKPEPGPNCTNTSLDLDIAMVLDISGSMSTPFGSGTRASVLKDISDDFVDFAPDTGQWQIGVVEFNASVFQTVNLINITGLASKTLVKSGITGSSAGLTNMGGGILKGTNKLNNSARFGTVNDSIVILVSDGLPNVPPPNATETAINASNSAKSQSMTIFTIGIAIDINSPAENLMEAIATNESFYCGNITQPADLETCFKNLKQIICQ